jgi:alanine racemase
MDAVVLAEISREAVRANLETIRVHLRPGVALCPAVKADAYGHSIRELLPVFREAQAERLAVANLEEAVQLRDLGWDRAILCLGAPLVACSDNHRRERAREAVARDVTCTISTCEEARLLADEAAPRGRLARAHVKIDTGMGRMGLLHGPAGAAICEMARCPGVNIEGIYTHFATADEPDLDFARGQLDNFSELTRALEAAGTRIPIRHACNSAGIFRIPAAHFDMVRPGLAVYGYWCGPDRPALRPALRVVSRIVAVRQISTGDSVGYGRTFTAAHDSTVGVVPIGYGDGYRRALGNSAVMTLDAVRGRPRQTVPVVGRVSMDQVSVDLTGVPDVRCGDPITIIDNDPAAPNSVEALAAKLGTIPYEITCLLGQRIRRVAV